MKKKEIKGLSAFELLEGLDDDLILSASLPEAAPVAVPTAGEKISAFFARMGKSGIAAAAITGIVVALAVLLGVALARPWGVIDSPDTDPSHGIHGSLPDTSNGIIAPPLTQSPEQEKGEVAVISDGITVYPQGYCVGESGQHRNEQGELEVFKTDGRGAVGLLDRLWDMLPVLRTAGNSYELALSDHMTLRDVRVFEVISTEGKVNFAEFALPAGSEAVADVLKSIGKRNGDYIVVLDIYSEINYSEDEYMKGLYEYAFCLTVDPSLNDTAPVRLIHGDKTYFPTGYLLEQSYYDAELKKEVVNHFVGAESILQELVKDMVTATVTQGESLSLYLAPYYDLKSVKVYRDLTLWALSETEEPLTHLSEWDTGDYYFIITAAHMGTGETTVTEFPVHVKVVEDTEQETEEETYPNDVGETPDSPCLTVVTGFDTLHFGNKNHSSEYHEGYVLWTEQWYDGGMVSGDGFGAEGQLTEIFAQLPWINHDMSETPTVRIVESNDTLTRVSVYDKLAQPIADGADTAVLSTLEEGVYAVILTVVTQGDYIEEADAHERTCTEYAFIMKVVEEHAGIPDVPETTPG